MPQYLHICSFTCVRYYKIAKEIVFKAELVFHFLSPPSPDSTPAVASSPQGGQELSLLRARNQSPVVLGIRGEIQRGRLTCLPREISKTHAHIATWLGSHKPPILWKEALCSWKWWGWHFKRRRGLGAGAGERLFKWWQGASPGKTRGSQEGVMFTENHWQQKSNLKDTIPCFTHFSQLAIKRKDTSDLTQSGGERIAWM